jgi:hypothetical protein
MKKTIGFAALTLGLLAGCSTATPTPTSPDKPEPNADTQLIAADGKAKLIAADGQPVIADDGGEWGLVGGPNYARVVNSVAGMTGDARLQRSVQRRGLSLVDVMWEDTGRHQGSSVGPNITDLTLQVRYKQAGQRHEQTALMPVIRFPNFTDRTGDVPADKFFLRVGNERNKERLTSVPLTEVLSNIKRYAARPWSIEGSGNLLAARDSHFLVSSQAVFLPIPKTGKAEFNPVVFNYQSAPGSPAVLSILVTRQGTSMSVVENRPESSGMQGWGQELYFNNEGQRAAFTAERKSTVKQRIDSQGGPKTADDRSALQKGADVLFLIQVPLKHNNRGVHAGLGGMMEMEDSMAAAGAPMAAPPAPMAKQKRSAKSDVEQAVLGHGKNRGPFDEGHGLKLERDERFPIRITVQFYKATSNGVASEADLDSIARAIGGVYEHADFVGSLVLPQGDALRPTAWNNRPAGWMPW